MTEHFKPQMETKPLSPGELKIAEYVERIRKGESKKLIYSGLSPAFIEGVEKGLTQEEGVGSTQEQKDRYGEFAEKHGETDIGMWWFQYKNQPAEELARQGKFEWGKERLYFDVSIDDCERLRDLVMEIAKQEKIPLSFKYIDAKKTFPVHIDGSETRFVVNFAIEDDARSFYHALASCPEYQFVTERTQSYGGYRVDASAEYANGYREQRGALARIVEGGQMVGGQMWEWTTEGGETRRIPEKEYLVFQKQYELLNKKIAESEEKWKQRK